MAKMDKIFALGLLGAGVFIFSRKQTTVAPITVPIGGASVKRAATNQDLKPVQRDMLGSIVYGLVGANAADIMRPAKSSTPDTSAFSGYIPTQALDEFTGLPSVTNADFLRTFDINTELAKSISNDVQKSLTDSLQFGE